MTQKVDVPLSQDEREQLIDLTRSDAWKAVLKSVERSIQKMERRLLAYNLSKGFEELALEKARVEGARQLQQAIESLKPGSRARPKTRLID